MKAAARLLLLLILLPLLAAPVTGQAQDQPYLEQASALLSQMSVAERVGQLFLVTFQGDQAGAGSEIADLVLRERVGGVVLMAEHDNFTGTSDTPQEVAHLTNSLQELALFGNEALAEATVLDEALPPSPTPAPRPRAVPLFVAVQQDQENPEYSAGISGLTPLPDGLAIGATWQPEQARKVGEIAGSELSAIGVNMFLGPSLDVLERPDVARARDLGTLVFGGDPYWVGQMGRAFIEGLHAGSQNRLAVVATHFPGIGSSDRPVDQEVATVRKSLEQLKQIELAPFLSVTGGAGQAGAMTDGLLTTHIRYQGFQGNIRATTAPVSFDPQALNTLMQLPELAAWRQQGGLIVSDELGVRSVQRFYDDTGQTFPHRRVAKDALLAGNDVLYVAQFALQGAEYGQQIANIKDTIAWFRDLYQIDPVFQQRVDAAATQVLATKLRLYQGDFSPSNVRVAEEQLPALASQEHAELFELAQSAITLLSPSLPELPERLPAPPGESDQIVIFTEIQRTRQCSQCPAEPLIGQDALEQRMLALYGPAASGQVHPDQFRSFSFADLYAFLSASPAELAPPTPTPPAVEPASENGLPPLEGPAAEGGATPSPEAIPPTPTPAQSVQAALQSADWIIFGLLQVDPANPDSQALNALLADRPDIARSARVVVFAFGAPYYLDTTEISKLTAYFGAYSHTPPFLDAAIRVLFQEAPVTGYSPVTIESIRYDLFAVTQPDPKQVIELFILSSGTAQSPPSEEPLEVKVGETLHLQTGLIRDRNGHPVPDGTLVRFSQLDRVNGFNTNIGERTTLDGVATLDYILEARTGQFRITASAGEATASQELDIVIGDNVIVVVITPTPAPTATQPPLPTSTITPVPSGTPPPTATVPAVAPPGSDVETPLRLALADLSLLTGLVAGLSLTVMAALGVGHLRRFNLAVLVPFALWGVLGGLVLYIFLALRLPGMGPFQRMGSGGAALVTVAGGLLGLVLFAWMGRRGRWQPGR